MNADQFSLLDIVNNGLENDISDRLNDSIVTTVKENFTDNGHLGINIVASQRNPLSMTLLVSRYPK